MSVGDEFVGKSFEELLAARQALWKGPKKSRWVGKGNELATMEANVRKRKKEEEERFPAAPVLALIARKHGIKELTMEEEQECALMIMQVEGLSAKLVTVVQDAAFEALQPDRPPSPPPIYGADGSRVNTREVRLRNKLKFERDALIKQILKLKPQWVTPPDYVRERPKRKLYIPSKEYPNYNFIGLVIGPRGQTQKAMEKETGAKIVIRGRGSVKEGARGRDDDGQDDELHVLITAESEEQVEAAQKLVMPLLQPIDDALNTHKQNQLKTLVKQPGTEKDPLKSHEWFNEQMSGKTYNANVKCAICGEPHATRDCPSRRRPQGRRGRHRPPDGGAHGRCPRRTWTRSTSSSCRSSARGPGHRRRRLFLLLLLLRRRRHRRRRRRRPRRHASRHTHGVAARAAAGRPAPAAATCRRRCAPADADAAQAAYRRGAADV